jgi:hypothetical protein
MEAINQNRSRTKIYGWFNAGFNVSTSNRGVGANSPAAYYYTPNTIVPDQEVLYIERLPNTVQTEHFDWGFRFAQLYGQDYRYTTSKGVFSQQLLLNNNPHGYDPVMYYIDLYFPHVAEGMNIRMGRYISLPDIEAQLAPNNYTSLHDRSVHADGHCGERQALRSLACASWFFGRQRRGSVDTGRSAYGNCLCGLYVARRGRCALHLRQLVQ